MIVTTIEGENVYKMIIQCIQYTFVIFLNYGFQIIRDQKPKSDMWYVEEMNFRSKLIIVFTEEIGMPDYECLLFLYTVEIQ